MNIVTPLKNFYSDNRDWLLFSPVRLAGFFFVLLLATFLLRLWQYGWAINDDGTLYLYTAKNYLDGGLAAALKSYSWPLYSVLIAWVDSLFFDDLVLSGWSLNFMFQLGQIYFIYRLGRLMEIDREKVFLALSLFVVSVSFHNFRIYLMRDQGFLLFIIAGTYFSIHYLNTLHKSSYALFVASFLVAVVFRIEALGLLIFGILALAAIHRNYTEMAVIIVLAVMVPALILWLTPDEKLPGAVAYVTNNVPDIVQNFENGKTLLEQHILPKYWHDYSGASYFSMYFGSYIIYLLGSLSIYLLGMFYVPALNASSGSRLLTVYGFAVVCYCFYFLISRGFLVFRYNQPLTYLLTMVSIVAVIYAVERKAKYAKIVLCLFVLVSLVKVFEPPSGSKRYLVEAQAVVEQLGLAGEGVHSNAQQVSLRNNIDFSQANLYRRKEALLYAMLLSPLKATEAVVLYGYKKTDIKIAPENCFVYRKVDRSRLIAVLTAKNDYCISQ